MPTVSVFYFILFFASSLTSEKRTKTMEPTNKRQKTAANESTDTDNQAKSHENETDEPSERPKWKLFISKSTGKHYWMNLNTKKSQWSPPVQDLSDVVVFVHKGENPRGPHHNQPAASMIRLDKLPPDALVRNWNAFAMTCKLSTLDPRASTKEIRDAIKEQLMKMSSDNYVYWNNELKAFVLPTLNKDGDHTDTLNVEGDNATNAHIGGFDLKLYKEAHVPRKHLVSVSVFRLVHAYRKSSKYAHGLLRLANTIKTELPGFVLRIYYDQSISKEAILSQDNQAEDESKEVREEDAKCWEDVFVSLEKMSHVELIEFRHPEFTNNSTKGHQDLFGTLARFLPLFESDCKLPRWADTLPQDTCVFVTDADYSGFSTEQAGLRLIRWFSSRLFQTDTSTPELVALSSASSQAPRHVPSFGTPPFIANCVATKTRYPLNILENFLQQAKSRKGLPKRYFVSLHHKDNHNYTYDRRNIAKQTSMFPFGVDEFFLTQTLKSFSAMRSTPCSWLFIVIPNIDRVMTQCLKAIKESENAIKEPKNAVEGILGADTGSATSVTHYEPVTLALQAAAGTAGENMATPESLDLFACCKRWPQQASKRLKLYTKDNTNLLHLDQGLVTSTLESFRLFLKHTAESISLGYIDASSQVQQLVLENLYQVNKMSNGKILRICCYSLGNGSVEEIHDSFGDKDHTSWKEELWAFLQDSGRSSLT